MWKCLLSALAFSPSLFSCAQNIDIVETTICQIRDKAASFDGKFVRVKARLVSGFEVYGIEDLNGKCMISLTNGGNGPVASTSFGSATPNISRPDVILDDNSEYKKFQQLQEAEMYPRHRGLSCVACHRYEVTATMVGRVDYAGEGKGFGHLNAAAARLVLQRVSEVAGKDISAKYDSKEFSVTKIRFPTGTIVGKLVAPGGKILEGAEINVHSVKDVPLYMQDFTEWTDEKGEFKIEVPPGNYVVGLNLESPPSPAVPFPPTYYPHTIDKKAAEVIEITDHQIKRIEIRLGNALEQRGYPVIVEWPNGTPVEEANVHLSELRNPTAVVGSSVSHTLKDGTFMLIGFKGVDYLVRADIYVKPTYKEYCAVNVLVKDSDVLEGSIRMVLTNSGDRCKETDYSSKADPVSIHIKH